MLDRHSGCEYNHRQGRGTCQRDQGESLPSPKSRTSLYDQYTHSGRAKIGADYEQDKSSARVTVSESIPGNPERILNVSGALDAVAKVCTPLVLTARTR